jgi:hypothetical protein
LTAVGRAFVAVAGAFLACAGPASAATPVTLSAAGQNGFSHQVAVAPEGTSTVVWKRSDGANPRIQMVRIAPNGTVGSVVDVSAAGADGSEAHVAVGADGVATVVWTRGGRVQMARVAANGTVGSPVDVSVAGGPEAFGLAVAVAASGVAYVVWQQKDAFNKTLIRAARIEANGAVGAPADLSAFGFDASSAQLGVASDGTFTVVWSQLQGSFFRAQAVRIAANGTVGTPVDISTSGLSVSTPQVAVAPDGTATAVFGQSARIQAVRIEANGTVGTQVPISAAGGATVTARMAVAPDGVFTVVWVRSSRAQAVRIAANGTIGTPVDLSVAGQDAFSADVAIAADGSGTATWQRYDGSSSWVQAIPLAADGVPGVAADVSASAAGAPGLNPHVAVASDGMATVVWSRSDGTNDRVQAARFAVALSRAPASLPLGSRDVDDGASASQSATVTNGGTEAITLTGVTVGGTDASDFQRLTGLGSDCAVATSLTAGQTCTIRVAFDPATTSAKSATVTVASNAPAITVALSGTGTQTELSGPAGLTFGSRDVDDGPTSAQTATLTNSGTEPLTLSGVTVTGGGAGDFERLTGLPGDCAVGTGLTAGQTCAVRVRFDPASTGAKDAVITVSSNAASVELQLGGSGIQTELSRAPAALAFGAREVDASP